MNPHRIIAFGADINASLNPGSPVVNSALEADVTINSSDNLNDGVVDVEIYDGSGNRVNQQFFEHQNISANQNYTVKANWTPGSTGSYKIKTGIFSTNWSQLYYWDDNVTSFNVAASQNVLTSAAASPSSSNGSYTTSLSGSSLSVKTPVSLSDGIVDAEIYDASGNRVNQQFFEHQNISANQTISYSLNWKPADTNNYTVKTGIFTANWAKLLNWNDNAGTFSSSSTPVSSAVVSSPSPVALTTQNTSAAAGAYSIGTDGRIYKNGQKIALDGVSWFGAETDTKVPHGLWLRNYKDMISQMKSLGFNAVRLPYCPQTLQNVSAQGVDSSLNPDLVGLKTLDVLDKIVNELNNQHMYVLLDNHRPDCNSQSDLWYTSSYSEQQWTNDLVMLASRYKNLDYFVGLDMKNEPRGTATWGTGNVATDWNLAVERAGKQILAANPNILLFVEGIENNSVCSNNSLGHWWGGNLEPVACKDIDPAAVPADKVVFTPHAYGPDTYNQSYFNTSDFPANMPAIWNQNFGFLKDKGRAVAIGEFGGKYGTGDPKDVTWQNSFVSYLTSKGICDNFYWDWNPNSGDTGGILNDDWSSVRTDKVNLLNTYHTQCR
ncbi:MAG TPA: glycoside hydrolase family 5 protein [Patescibacteria group bacterium]